MTNKCHKRCYNLIIERTIDKNLKKFNFIKKNIPSFIDLRNDVNTVYDQEDLSSCTANALCSMIRYNNPNLKGSRLFLYYNERVLDNNIFQDVGAKLSDGIQSLLKHGLCHESEWEYDITKYALKPPDECYLSALENKAKLVQNINNDTLSMKLSLINGNPFVVGISIYESFESDEVENSGIVKMPQKDEECLGGHACLVVGYDDEKQHWIMQNSWGPDWGDNGYFYLPYKYLLDPKLSSDLWFIRV